MSGTDQDFSNDIKSYLTINDILQVRLSEEKNSTTYYSRINDIVDGKLIIAWPTNGGIRLMARQDQILDFSFMKNGVPSSFTGLIDDTAMDPMPQITIILSSTITQIQRRQNVRIKCLVPLEVTGAITENAQDGTVSPLYIKTTTYDLSASGIAIRYTKRIPEGSLVEIKLGLPDNKPVIRIPGCVVYSEEFSENAKIYRMGVQYLTISEAERARIVRYVYRTQLSGLNS
jgi:c-di-GMP-binding flagellar brake protein YcgR